MADSTEILDLPINVDKEYGIYIVGLGGIGSWLVEPVMRFLHSKKVLDKTDIVLIDGDKYDEGNRGRQVAHPKLLGMNKAAATAVRLRAYFPEASIIEVPQFISKQHESYFQAYGQRTFIFSCADNNVCRKALSDIAIGVGNVSLMTAGNELHDGNVHLFHRNMSGQTRTIIEAHPELADPKDGDRSAMSCEEVALLPSGGQIIPTNFMCAAIMLMKFYQAWECDHGEQPTAPKSDETFFDIKSGNFNSV